MSRHSAVIFFCFIALLAASLATTAQAHGQVHRALDNFSDTSIWQVATAANTSGNSTIIDNAWTNGDPGAILLVNQDLNNESGTCGCVVNNHPVGVWYNNSNARWEIFNEDNSAIPLGAAFGIIVWIGPRNQNGRIIYSHVAGVQTTADYTDINNAVTNGNPNAIVFVTPVWNPLNQSLHGVFDNHTIGVWYDTGTGRWAVFNEDGAPMPTGAAFNIIAYAAGDGTIVYSLTSNASNTAANYTNLTIAESQGVGGLDVIHVYRTCLKGCPTYFNHNLGTWLNSTVDHMSFFTEDGATMPYNLTFNILNQHF